MQRSIAQRSLSVIHSLSHSHARAQNIRSQETRIFKPKQNKSKTTTATTTTNKNCEKLVWWEPFVAVVVSSTANIMCAKLNAWNQMQLTNFFWCSVLAVVGPQLLLRPLLNGNCVAKRKIDFGIYRPRSSPYTHTHELFMMLMNRVW